MGGKGKLKNLKIKKIKKIKKKIFKTKSKKILQTKKKKQSYLQFVPKNKTKKNTDKPK